jgi:hypothetical protein
MPSRASASCRQCNSKTLAKFPVAAIFSGKSRYRPAFHSYLQSQGGHATKYALAGDRFSAILTRGKGYTALRQDGYSAQYLDDLLAEQTWAGGGWNP